MSETPSDASEVEFAPANSLGKNEGWRKYLIRREDAMTPRSAILNEPMKQCAVEVTLNYPRTAAFNRMSDQEQKHHYRCLFKGIFYEAGLNRYIDRFEYVFEECQDKMLHLHGILYLDVPPVFYANGLIRDIVIAYLSKMPRRYAKFYPEHLRYEYSRYQFQGLCAQYRDLGNEHDLKRVQLFKEYMRKTFKARNAPPSFCVYFPEN